LSHCPTELTAGAEGSGRLSRPAPGHAESMVKSTEEEAYVRHRAERELAGATV